MEVYKKGYKVGGRFMGISFDFDCEFDKDEECIICHWNVYATYGGLNRDLGYSKFSGIDFYLQVETIVTSQLEYVYETVTTIGGVPMDDILWTSEISKHIKPNIQKLNCYRNAVREKKKYFHL